jgi:hypothetical protein
MARLHFPWPEVNNGEPHTNGWQWWVGVHHSIDINGTSMPM